MVTREQEAVAAAAGAAALAGPRPDDDAVWRALATVADPEIPVVSVVELGMVRGFEWEVPAGTLVVRITPTYSGCPAIDFIDQGVRAALATLGIGRVRIERVLAPAWTTDWIGEAARAKLQAYGIAPPAARATVVGASAIARPLRTKEVVPCPRCGSKATQPVSPFGSTACKAQYRCTGCLEPFDYFKPH